ncbi:MAG: class I mannose-6-phosphate isomerase [Anaerolineae bacterium]|nr:class I mannose-6-phosphate isomerase [Anaerolineae bacterium]
MTTTTLYPLLLESRLHIKVWGGRKLASVLNKTLPTADPYGEAWELHDQCTITNGVYAGQTLGQLLNQFPQEMIGKPYDVSEGFPLLVKFIHAEDWLSVQVHPNDEQAAELEGEPRGKTEAWIILHAEPDAKLVMGIIPNTSHEAVAHAIATNTLEPLLVYQTVKAGDILFMHANTIHAIGPGIVLYEVQQSSDTTYRLYDWGRMDLDGKPRPLHIEKGVKVSNLVSLPIITHTPLDGDNAPMIESDFFSTLFYSVSADKPASLDTGGKTFHGITNIAGELTIQAGGVAYPLGLGQTALIPAVVGAYTVSGNGKMLVSW